MISCFYGHLIFLDLKVLQSKGSVLSNSTLKTDLSIQMAELLEYDHPDGIKSELDILFKRIVCVKL